MGIPSIDTYLYREIESKLKIILSNRYIIEEILKEVQTDVSESFIERYVNNKGSHIPIIYTLPQEKVTQRGAIYIGLRQGEESDQSVGNIEDTYTYKEDGFNEDNAVVQLDSKSQRLYLEVSNPIGELETVKNLAFADSDNVTIEGNRVYFTYDPDLIGLDFDVQYTAENTRVDEKGLKKGFTTTEYYSVLAISTNMDTVRCLDLIIKAILILMRDNAEEKTNFLLQKLQFGQIEEMNVDSSEPTPEILYGRETIVMYTSSYSLDVPILNEIKDFEVVTRNRGRVE